MRTLLASSLLFGLLATLATGCSCGAFSGGGDSVYSRNSDQLILCENGGFVAKLQSQTIEGRYTPSQTGTGGTAVRGDTGAIAFTLTENPDGTATTTELGGDAWIHMNLSTTDLDHADVMCSDLLTRAWWGTP